MMRRVVPIAINVQTFIDKRSKFGATERLNGWLPAFPFVAADSDETLAEWCTY